MNTSHNSPQRDSEALARQFQRIRHARQAARDDPSAFVSYCFTDPCGRPIRQAGLHDELQQFLTRHAKALVQLPRDHGKSFQVCCRIAWELGHNTGLRVKVVCATGAVAEERARFVREAIESNARVQFVFPELRRNRPWAAAAFAVERPANVIGPSVTAYGIGAGSTGTRADLLVCDDIVDVHAIRSKAQRDRTADYFTNNLMNLLEPDGRCWCLSTPWHADDLNARLSRNPSFEVFRRAVGPDLEPVWPEKWPADRLLARRDEIGSASFARGYLLRTMAEEDAVIRPQWVRYWDGAAEPETVVLSVDPAVSLAASADRSALVVLGRVGGDGCAPQVRVLSCTARRVQTPELVGLIDAIDRQWNPAVILFESNAAFLGVKDLLVRDARFGPRVKGVTQSKDKAARVAAFSVVVENGGFRLAGDGLGGPTAGQRELFDEMTAFPFGEHDDLLDAAATGCAYLLDRREPRAW